MHVVMCRILKAKKKKELWQAEGSEGRWTWYFVDVDEAILMCGIKSINVDELARLSTIKQKEIDLKMVKNKNWES